MQLSPIQSRQDFYDDDNLKLNWPTHVRFSYVFNIEDFDLYAKPDSMTEDNEDEGDNMLTLRSIRTQEISDLTEEEFRNISFLFP